MESLADILMSRPPTPARPLLGLTILVVEDSRHACEALRLLALRSGARLRRADTLAHARQHLRVYRPAVVIVDIGLPDGSGAELLSELANASPRIEAILATSGDPATEPLAFAAGADGFLAKPVRGLSEFQQAILAHLPPERHPGGPRPVFATEVEPDPLALHEDLEEALDHLDGLLTAPADAPPDPDRLSYVLGFLITLAQDSGDTPLLEAASALRATAAPAPDDLHQLRRLIDTRIAGGTGRFTSLYGHFRQKIPNPCHLYAQITRKVTPMCTSKIFEVL